MTLAEILASDCNMEGDTCFFLNTFLKSKPTLRLFVFSLTELKEAEVFI